ncbi:MAG: hypothetical protein ACHQEB_06475 [Chitinophagales bacterium]
MKKTILFFFIITIVAAACHKKAVPTFSTRSIDINETAKKNNRPPDLESGKSTFTARCNRCHNLPDPVKYTAQRFDIILPIMIPRARLTREEADNVTAYLKANCSK